MKQHIISIFLSIAIAIALPLTSFADGTNKKITILYSGDILGHITPIRG